LTNQSESSAFFQRVSSFNATFRCIQVIDFVICEHWTSAFKYEQVIKLIRFEYQICCG